MAENIDKSNWYDRAKIILGSVATISASMIGLYFTWSQNEHAKLAKEIEITKSITESPELGLNKLDLSMAYLESISDNDMYRRIISSLPEEKKASILSRTLYRAISIKDYRTIQRIMEVIRPLEIHPNTRKQLPLEAATIQNDLELMETLIENGFDPIREPYGIKLDGLMALKRASEYGFVKLIKYLLEKGINPNETNDHEGKSTPLHYAVANYKVDSIRTLISGGADLSILDHQGKTPLIVNLSRDFSENALRGEEGDQLGVFLLKMSANPNDFIHRPVFSSSAEKYGSALELAVASNYEKTFSFLLKGVAPIGTIWGESEKNHIAFLVIQYGHKKMLEKLLEQEMNPNDIRSSKGNSLLHNSAGYYPEIVKILTNAGVDPNARGNNNMTPMISWFDFPFAAISTEFIEERVPQIIKSLYVVIAAGGDVNLHDKNNNTVLCYAARFDNEQLLDVLLNAGGALVDKICDDNQTALEISVARCNVDNVSYLTSYKPELAHIRAENLINIAQESVDYFKKIDSYNENCESTLNFLKRNVLKN